MMSSILNINNNIARKYAVDLGIAFQLTNIARDILEDAKINRIYIPYTWYSLTTKEIKKLNDKSKEKLKSATKDLLNMADLYYQSAFKGLAFLSLRNRFAILLALVIYKQIGVKIINKNYSNLYIREKVSFLEKLICLMKCVFLFIFNFKIHKKYMNITKFYINILKIFIYIREIMMKAKSFDYVILGGGCAALSLASHIYDKNINNLSFFNIRKKKKIYR